MKLREIDEKTYQADLDEYYSHNEDGYKSPSGDLCFELEYQGEYPHGDSYYYGFITDGNSRKIWEYNKGDKIRQLYDNPWSPDGRTVYFGLVEKGNKIAKYDIGAEACEIVFKCQEGEKRLNWLHFVPQSFNGVIVDSVTYTSGQEQHDYFVYRQESGELIALNNLFQDRIFPCHSRTADCIYILASEKIYLFDVAKKEIRSQAKNELLAQGYFPDGKPIFLHTKQEANLQLYKEGSVKYLKIY